MELKIYSHLPIALLTLKQVQIYDLLVLEQVFYFPSLNIAAFIVMEKLSTYSDTKTLTQKYTPMQTNWNNPHVCVRVNHICVRPHYIIVPQVVIYISRLSFV